MHHGRCSGRPCGGRMVPLAPAILPRAGPGIRGASPRRLASLIDLAGPAGPALYLRDQRLRHLVTQSRPGAPLCQAGVGAGTRPIRCIVRRQRWLPGVYARWESGSSEYARIHSASRFLPSAMGQSSSNWSLCSDPELAQHWARRLHHRQQQVRSGAWTKDRPADRILRARAGAGAGGEDPRGGEEILGFWGGKS